MITEQLKKWATTDRQCEYIDAVILHGSNTKAADALGIDRRVVDRTLNEIEKRAASEGYSPAYDLNHQTAPGFTVKGTTTLYDENGQRLQWVKTEVDKQQREEIIRETVEAFTDEIKPCKPTKAPKKTSKDLLTAYCIGDAHIGMYAWGEETGEDFDSRIASNDIIAAAHRLVDSTPESEECLIVQLGDFYHIDDSTNETPKHRNRQDADTRFRKVIRTGILTMRAVIETALRKHKTVRVRNVAGNHDPHAYVALDEALQGYYHKEKRVIIENSPKPLFIYRFGKNLIGITHGHAPKPEKCPGNLAVLSGKDWGECEYKYIWHGHIHNKRVFEDMNVLVESFRTLAAKDAWHTEQGYLSGREMQAIVLHREYGEIERHTAGIKQVRSKAELKN